MGAQMLKEVASKTGEDAAMELPLPTILASQSSLLA
jgi:hypothetical protein